MEGIKLRPYDGVALAGLLILPALFSTELSALVRQNGTAAWITLPAAFGIVLCLFLLTLSLMKRYPGKNLIAVAQLVLGKPLGFLYGIALGLYFSVFSGLHIRECAELIQLYGFDLTPIAVIGALIFLTALFLNFFGGKAIVKSAGFFFMLILLGIVFVLFLGSNRYQPGRLVPMLGNGAWTLAKNSLFSASLFAPVIILPLLAPAFASTKAMKKSGILSTAVCAAAFVLLSLCYVMMFSASIASNMMSGFMEMGKSSYYNHFFYRFESLLLFFLLFASVMLVTIGMFTARESFCYALKQKVSKIGIAVCALPAVLTACIPADILALTETFLPAIRRCGIFFLMGFPLLLWVIDSIKRWLQHEKH